MSDCSLSVATSRICHSGVEVVESDAELFAPLEIVQERVVCLFCTCFVDVSEVHQVRAVWHYVLGLVVKM